MGIRIHKAMGYGLLDVDVEEDRIIDTRFTEHFRENFYELEGSKENYLEWLKENKIKSQDGKISPLTQDNFDNQLSQDMLILEPVNWSPESSIIFNPEFGLPNVFCVIPPGYYGKWFRYDDDIDYTEENMKMHRGELAPSSPHVNISEYGFYPYIPTRWDIRNGEQLDRIFQERIFQLKNIDPRFWDKDNFIEECRENGFSSIDEVFEYAKPFCPAPVRNLCNFFNIFEDESSYWQFVPMIYTYWC